MWRSENYFLNDCDEKYFTIDKKKATEKPTLCMHLHLGSWLISYIVHRTLKIYVKHIKIGFLFKNTQTQVLTLHSWTSRSPRGSDRSISRNMSTSPRTNFAALALDINLRKCRTFWIKSVISLVLPSSRNFSPSWRMFASWSRRISSLGASETSEKSINFSISSSMVKLISNYLEIFQKTIGVTKFVLTVNVFTEKNIFFYTLAQFLKY